MVAALALILLLSVGMVANLNAFQSGGRAFRRLQQISMQAQDERPELSKSVILMKKKKLKEIQGMKDEIAAVGAEHPVNVFLISGDRGPRVKEPINFFNHTNVVSTGCLSVLSEYNQKAETGFIVGMPAPEIMGGVLRDAGSRAIVISMDKRSGGSSYDDFQRFAIEQSKAKLYMPSPVPLVWHDFVVDSVQISQAASLGASAITIYPDFTDSTMEGDNDNSLEALVQQALSLNVEPIAMVDNLYNAKAALAAGVRCVCLHLMTEKELLLTREQLPDTTTSGQQIMYCGKLRPETDYSAYAEIDTAWMLRDSKFQSVWPSPVALYATGMSDIYTTVLALRSKASRVFLSPRQFLMDRKKEGAQEYLGDILY